MVDNVDESGNDNIIDKEEKEDYYYDYGENINITVLATILKFNPSKLSWTEVGNMTQARYRHGASVVNVEDVEKFCV